MKKQPIIAIDGPAGAGKSTIAKLLAQRMQLLYIDTGAMYRALAYKAIINDVKPEEVQKLINIAQTTDITLVENEARNISVLLDGEDVTQEIRSQEVTALVSQVAAIPSVRMCMVEQQRSIARQGGVVMDGRDIGTFVLPEADIKFFLTASIEERAQRRFLELTAKGIEVNIEVIGQEILTRDAQDENRAFAPLRQADDAILIDTSGLAIDEVLNKMISFLG